MKITIVCLEEKTQSIKSEIEELGIDVKSCKEDTIVVDASEAGYEAIMEIPGIISANKSNFFDNWT